MDLSREQGNLRGISKIMVNPYEFANERTYKCKGVFTVRLVRSLRLRQSKVIEQPESDTYCQRFVCRD